jgi:hypothetical protein
MLNANLILGMIAPAFQLALAGIFIRRRHYTRFPWFFAYTLYSVGATVARLAVMAHPRLFYNLYWTSEIIYGALALLAMREIFKVASDIFYFGRGWPRLVPSLAVLAVIAYSVWQALYHAPGTAAMAHLQAGAYSLLLGIRYLEVGICFLCLRLSWRANFPITWRRYDFSILVGFGIFGLFTLLVYLARLIFAERLETVFRYAPAVAYIFTTAIWLRAFLREEPPHNKVPPSLREIQNRLDILDQGSDKPKSDNYGSVSASSICSF